MALDNDATKQPCQHENFAVNVEVTRMEDKELFAADVTIKCADCQQPFKFLGLPCGLDLQGATTSVDQTEARLAIAPYDEKTRKQELLANVESQGELIPFLRLHGRAKVND